VDFEGDGFQNVALITAGGVLSPNNDSQAIAIKKLIIDDVTVLANILAGYDLDADPFNADASIGSVTVGVRNGKGSWTASDLVAGVDTGADRKFGTGDDVLIDDSHNVSKDRRAHRTNRYHRRHHLTAGHIGKCARHRCATDREHEIGGA
jgi:hypothetical protein